MDPNFASGDFRPRSCKSRGGLRRALRVCAFDIAADSFSLSDICRFFSIAISITIQFPFGV